MATIELLPVRTQGGAPFVIVSPTSSGTEVRTPSGVMDTNKVPLDAITVGSPLAVRYGNKTKYYRVIGVAIDGIVVERIKKAEAEKLFRDYSKNIERNIDSLVRITSRVASGKAIEKEIRELTASIDAMKRELENLRKVHSRINTELENLNRVVVDEFDPTPIIKPLKKIVQLVGAEKSTGSRWELSTGGRDLAVHIVFDKGKNMFYIKAGRGGFLDYVYFEKDGEQKFSRSPDKWANVLETVGKVVSEAKNVSRDELVEAVNKMLREAEKQSDKVSRVCAETTKKLAMIVKGLFPKYPIKIDSYDTITLLERAGKKKLAEELSKALNGYHLTLVFKFDDKGKFKYVEANGGYWKAIPPSRLYGAVALVYYTAIALKEFSASKLPEMNKMISEAEKLIGDVQNILKKYEDKLNKLGKELLKTMPKKETSYGFTVRVGDLIVGVNKRGEVLYIRDTKIRSYASSYIYSSDMKTIKSVMNAVARILNELKYLKNL